MAEPKSIKVFISYCWTTPTHEDWVINLAERLMADGIEVIIDKWDLKSGHDKYSFMESMVTSPDINKVLLILDKKYSEKANDRSGGVGTETQIISPQIYSNVSQEKFIPVVVERDENGKEFLPAFLESRIYVDLSSPEHFESNYEKLLRDIYQRPAYVKPKLGKAPSHIFEDDVTTHRTASIVRSFDVQYDKNPQKINSIVRDFLLEFYENLKAYTITFSSRDLNQMGKEVVDNLNSYSALRNDLINFYRKISSSDVQFDIEILIKFLEKLSLLKRPLDDKSSWSNHEFDNFRFIIHELFLYLITIAIENENYKLVEELLYSSYFMEDKYQTDSEPKRFDCFYNYVEIFDSYYKQTYSQNFHSPMADFIIKRTPNEVTRDALIQADLVCFYVSQINGLRWFPITYVYNTTRNFNLFRRMTSKRHFEKVKIIFNVNTIQEMKDLLVSLKEKEKDVQSMRYASSMNTIIPLYNMIEIEKIGTTK